MSDFNACIDEIKICSICFNTLVRFLCLDWRKLFKAFFRLSSFSYSSARKNCFKCLNKWKSIGKRSGEWGGCCRISYLNSFNFGSLVRAVSTYPVFHLAHFKMSIRVPFCKFSCKNTKAFRASFFTEVLGLPRGTYCRGKSPERNCSNPMVPFYIVHSILSMVYIAARFCSITTKFTLV